MTSLPRKNAGITSGSRIRFINNWKGCKELCAASQLIVTTTPSQEPLVTADMIQPGTHITAMGSDSAHKNELAPNLLVKADKMVVDSLSQCANSGELHHALDAGLITKEDAIELGSVITDPSKGRSNDRDITIADLTGVAVQDIAIALAVTDKLETCTQ